MRQNAFMARALPRTPMGSNPLAGFEGEPGREWVRRMETARDEKGSEVGRKEKRGNGKERGTKFRGILGGECGGGREMARNGKAMEGRSRKGKGGEGEKGGKGE